MKIDFNDFLNNLSEAIEDESIKSADFNNNLDELECWDSFALMSVVAMLDHKYRLIVKYNELNSANTVNKMFDLVSNKLNNA